MKSDLDLVRSILLNVEAGEAGQPISSFTFDGETESEIPKDVAILTENGYRDAGIVEDEMRMPHGFVGRLTWSGHEFLANAKNDTVWKKVMDQVGDKATSISITVMTRCLLKRRRSFSG